VLSIVAVVVRTRLFRYPKGRDPREELAP